MKVPDPKMPMMEMMKTSSNESGKSMAPANTKGVLGIKNSPRIKQMSAYTSNETVLNCAMNSLIPLALNCLGNTK